MMCSISFSVSAFGVTKGWGPSQVMASPSGRMALGATGSLPLSMLGWEIRPQYHNWQNMRPPAPCTASVSLRQPATCSGEWIPGVAG